MPVPAPCHSAPSACHSTLLLVILPPLVILSEAKNLIRYGKQKGP